LAAWLGPGGSFSALLVLFCPVDPFGPVDLIPEILLGPKDRGNYGHHDSQEN
jgi:hypothetical protein